MAEYGSMFAVSGLAAILFFGGWNGPMPIARCWDSRMRTSIARLISAIFLGC